MNERLQLSDIFATQQEQGKPTEKFTNPKDEIEFLRRQLAEKEAQAEKLEVPVERQDIAEHVVEQYKDMHTHEVLDDDFKHSDEESQGIALRLSPEAHDDTMAELYGIMSEKGIKNALDVIDRMDNPHIDDDFHRFLVQYLQAQHSIPGLTNKSELYRALDMRLFEVTLPEPEEGEQSATQLISIMEQFLAGMQSVSSGTLNLDKHYYGLEVALSAGTDEIVFYVAVPANKAGLFEKQIFALYDDAKIEEVYDDYNPFFEDGVSVGSYAKPQYKDYMQIKTHDAIDHDPLKVLLNVFSKLDVEKEGAAIQIMVRPVGDTYIKDFRSKLERLKKGEHVDDVFREGKELGKSFWKVSKELITGDFEKDGESSEEEKKRDEEAIESLTEKLKSTIVETNIRIVASAHTRDRAQDILGEVQSAFQQFSDTRGNGVFFEKAEGAALKRLLHDYSYRMFYDKKRFRLNLKEIATMYHFPISSDSAPQLKQSKSGSAPVPAGLPQSGTLLGENVYRGQTKRVYYDREDRVRHFYVIGQTGTGKTNILKNLIVQDIRNGEGVCFIDPHGSDVDDILSLVPPERMDDVIYFDPAATDRPMAFNMLEYDESKPEQKSFVIDEMFGIFNKLFDMKNAGGPMFEQYFRNATALVVDDPSSGSTLLDVSRVLADEEFRRMKLSRCKNPIIVQFWEEIAGKAGGEASLENIVPYVTSKFDVFLANDIMRPIVAQQKSSFSFKDVMDNQKILLVNLSKGRLGDINANLLGLIMVGKILMAALGRVDMHKSERKDFYLYIDEFQNVTTDSISQILSEARKYRLSLNIAHQFIAQLDEGIKNAVFGNVGSMAVFRVSSDDAQYLESRFKPTFNATDIIKIDNYNCYMSMLAHGQPVKPFNLKTMAPEDGNEAMAQKLKELSALKYGRPRQEVESEIMEKYRKMKGDA